MMDFLQNPIFALGIISVLVFILGSAIGSFNSVLINRLQLNEKGILFGKSKCPNCKHSLKSQDLIPIFSYILNHGKCRFCHKKISKEYPISELLTGTTFALVFTTVLNFNPNLEWYQWLLLTLILWILSALTYSDLKYKEVSNLLLIKNFIIFTAGFWLLTTQTINPTNSLLTLRDGLMGAGICLLIFGIQILLSRGKWLGTGDLYFSIPVGFWLGWQATFFWLTGTYILGSLIAIYILATKKHQKHATIAFLPFLIITIIPAAIWGQTLFNWYFNFTI